MIFCALKDGPLKAPDTNAAATIIGNVSAPAQCSSGSDRITGPRTPSQSIIVRRAPIRATSFPPGIAPAATPISAAATTRLMRVAEPDVSSTNQGSASQVICDPVVETISAASSAASERFRSIELARDGGGANDGDVAAEALEAQLGHRAFRGLPVANLELGRDVAAP